MSHQPPQTSEPDHTEFEILEWVDDDEIHDHIVTIMEAILRELRTDYTMGRCIDIHIHPVPDVK